MSDDDFMPVARHPELYERGFCLAEQEAALLRLEREHLDDFMFGRVYRHHPTRPLPLEGRFPSDVDTLSRQISFSQGYSEGWSATLCNRWLEIHYPKGTTS